MDKHANKILAIGLVILFAGFFIYTGIDSYLVDQQVSRDAEKLANDIRIQDLETKLQAQIDKPAQVITKTVMNTVVAKTETSIAEIVAQWSPYVAQVACIWMYSDTGEPYAYATGSSTIMPWDVGLVAFTNKHVLLDDDGYGPAKCKIITADGYREAFDSDDAFMISSDGMDYGWIELDKARQYPIGVFSNLSVSNFCYEDHVSIGDKVVVLGYPTIGSDSGITATEGIVSGIEGDYYVTSAKIDHGNSGGATILVKDNCYLGIPSASIAGEIESLGRILKADSVFN